MLNYLAVLVSSIMVDLDSSPCGRNLLKPLNREQIFDHVLNLFFGECPSGNTKFVHDARELGDNTSSGTAIDLTNTHLVPVTTDSGNFGLLFFEHSVDIKLHRALIEYSDDSMPLTIKRIIRFDGRLITAVPCSKLNFAPH